MGRRYRYVLGTAVVVLVLAAAGCGGGGGGEAASPSTIGEPSPTSEPTSPSTVLTDEEAVLAAYQGYWDAVLAAGDPPNPQHPDLARFATGVALGRSRESIAQRRDVGQLVRLPANAKYRHDASIESLNSGRAILRDCSVDDGLVVAFGTDQVLDDSVVTRELQGTMVCLDGRWLVEDVTFVSSWEGVAGCAA